jgi:tRNA-2-methylthio-N6-dimethylallyladenosine synthase
VAQDRLARLVDVVERHALAHNEERVGRVEEVLVEGPSKRDPSRWSGRTRQNKLLHFAPAEAAVAPGAIATATVTHAAPHWLAGDLLEVTAPARSARSAHTRLPVVAG